jgi:hypothetical protein
MGIIESIEGEGRRRPYRLTPSGAIALEAKLAAQRRVADVGLARLSGGLVTG